MRCPNCDALNPDDAKWCGLCFTPFERDEAAEGESLPELEVNIPPTVVPPSPPEVERAWQRVGETLGEGGGEKKAAWECPVCEATNSLEADRCGACGITIYDAFARARAEAARPPKDPRAAAALSVLPGVGHLYLGLVAEGVVRVVLAVWWLGSAVLLSGAPSSLGPVRAIFILAVAGLVVVSVIDAFRAASTPGTPAILSRKVILYSALGVVGLSTFGALMSALRLRR